MVQSWVKEIRLFPVSLVAVIQGVCKYTVYPTRRPALTCRICLSCYCPLDARLASSWMLGMASAQTPKKGRHIVHNNDFLRCLPNNNLSQHVACTLDTVNVQTS
jgi:hypothetical protein